MLRVLIVDDEAIIRYGIKSMIGWDKIGFKVVGDAANGEEALELFKAYNPQIVITDIKMPVMDGIELIKNIKGINADVKIIILSCLQDFDYAREAIRLGASEYLVKSDMMPSDLEDVLLKVKESIDVEKEKLQEIEAIRQEAQKVKLIEKGNFLWEFSIGSISKDESVIETIKQLKLDYLNGNVFVINLDIDYCEKIFSCLSEYEKRNKVVFLIETIKKELANFININGEVYEGDNGEINLIAKISGIKSEKDIFDFIHVLGENIISSVKNQAGFSITIGISDNIENILNIKDGYFQARTACRYKMFLGCGKVIHYKNAVNSKASDNKVYVNAKEFRDYVYSGRRRDINYCIERMFEKMAEAMDFDGVNLTALELVFTLSNIYSEICEDYSEVAVKKKEYYEQVKYLETVNDLKNWFKNSFGQLIDVVGQVYDRDKNVIYKALNYINENYNRDINLKAVSDYVHLSKNYFVNIFKKEVGESFVEYLTRIRVERAKVLLKNPELRISEVGGMVGIEDQKYFSKVFKKITGMTPTQYKEQENDKSQV